MTMLVGVKVKSRYTDTKSGYIKLYLENGIVVEEHRYIMANHLGRELDSNEIVHHNDENKQHNEISNLILTGKRAHARNHGLSKGALIVVMRCFVCGIIFPYAYYSGYR